jgi:ubiquitin-protein ligase
MNATICSQILNKDILLELDKLQENGLKKRLKNELNDFAKAGAFIRVECNNYERNNTIISIIIMLENDENLYKFDISRNYPFRPPIVQINYRDYKQYLMIDSLKTKNELKKYNRMNCLCCNSISCGDIWTPTIGLKCFINEYKIFQKLRRNIVNRVLAKKIIDKYLYPDANLFEWLL